MSITRESNQEQAAGADATGKIHEMRIVLLACALEFRRYEHNHLNKKPPEWEKAQANARHAEMCEKVLRDE